MAFLIAAHFLKKTLYLLLMDWPSNAVSFL